MNRQFALFTAALTAAGLLSFSEAGFAQNPPPGGAPAPATNAPAPTRPTVAVFNMAAVMRDFGQAKYQVWLLNKRKTEESKKLVELRGEYIQLNQDLQRNPQHPEKDAKQRRMIELQRLIEDEDRRINKLLNDAASAIISDLYDKIKTVIDRTAEMNGYHVVFAYPDAVTKEEMNNAYIKELKLKPPAAQPFYVAPHADITGVVVKALNAWYPPVDSQGKVVDVNKLDEPPALGPNNTPNTGVPNGGTQPQPQPQPPVTPVVPGR